mgnify:CR=1 FL=1
MQRTIILGAGLSGSIMYAVLNGKALVLEKNPYQHQGHQAVLHFRNPLLGQLLDLPLQSIQVVKAIYYKGQHYTESNLFFNNMYSLKITSVLTDRSIGTLESGERWFMKDNVTINHIIAPDVNHYQCCMVALNNYGIMCQQGGKDITYPYDVLISTLPLPFLLQKLNMQIDWDFTAVPIFIARLTLPEEFSTVCQTLYYPDLDYSVYRATIDHQKVIMETLSKDNLDSQLQGMFTSFGLPLGLLMKIPNPIITEQAFGKIKPLPNDMCKAVLYELTTKYNIYSLGRFALWKNLRAEDIYQDALKIKKMIQYPISVQRYLLHKEVT